MPHPSVPGGGYRLGRLMRAPEMAKKKADSPVTRDKLLRAVENIPDGACLWTGHAVNPNNDFARGLCLHRSERMGKGQVVAEINASQFQRFSTVPGHDDYLLLTPRLYVSKDDINQSQRFPTVPDAERYTHVTSKFNPCYDIYFRLAWEHKTITFALGRMKKEIPVVEGTDWCWKPSGGKLLCQSMERLEQNFLDPFWNPIAVRIGRKVLGVRPVV